MARLDAFRWPLECPLECFSKAILSAFLNGNRVRHPRSMPADAPNTYTITLWDLATWSEVDVVVDERLAAKATGDGLLGCEPSVDGELWVCYLEKAVAIHCGGCKNHPSMELCQPRTEPGKLDSGRNQLIVSFSISFSSSAGSYRDPEGACQRSPK